MRETHHDETSHCTQESDDIEWEIEIQQDATNDWSDDHGHRLDGGHDTSQLACFFWIAMGDYFSLIDRTEDGIEDRLDDDEYEEYPKTACRHDAIDRQSCEDYTETDMSDSDELTSREAFDPKLPQQYSHIDRGDYTDTCEYIAVIITSDTIMLFRFDREDGLITKDPDTDDDE